MKSHTIVIRMLRAEVTVSGWESLENPKNPDKPGGQTTRQATGGWRKHQKVTKNQNVSPAQRSVQPTPRKQTPENNARERNRVRTLRQAFLSLQAALPSVPPDTKLSKLDVLVLATSYIAHLTQTLDQGGNLLNSHSTHMERGAGYLHPMKKWPMRARLYAEALESEFSTGRTTEKH